MSRIAAPLITRLTTDNNKISHKNNRRLQKNRQMSAYEYIGLLLRLDVGVFKNVDKEIIDFFQLPTEVFVAKY